MNPNDLTHEQLLTAVRAMLIKQPKRMEAVLNDLPSFESIFSNIAASESKSNEFCGSESSDVYFKPIEPKRCFTNMTDKECRFFVEKVFQARPTLGDKILDNLESSMDLRHLYAEKEEVSNLKHDADEVRRAFSEKVIELYEDSLDELRFRKGQRERFAQRQRQQKKSSDINMSVTYRISA